MAGVYIFGDSIAAGAWDVQGGWAARLIAHLNQKTIQEKDFYCMPYNLGIAGDCAPDITQRMENELLSRCSRDSKEPMTTILAVGVNDSQFLVKEKKQRFSVESFGEEVLKIIDIVESFSGKTIILGLAPVDEHKVNPMEWAPEKAYRNDLIQDFHNKLEKISIAKKLSFIDLYNLWINEPYQNWLSDGVHPNTEGHKRIFQIVLKKLEELNTFVDFKQIW